jgi:hypothetical protein
MFDHLAERLLRRVGVEVVLLSVVAVPPSGAFDFRRTPALP